MHSIQSLRLATVATMKFDLLETLRSKFVNHHYYFDASDDDVDVELPFHNEIRSDQAENDSDWRETEIFGQMKLNLEALRMFQKQQNQYDSYQKEWIRMMFALIQSLITGDGRTKHN